MGEEDTSTGYCLPEKRAKDGTILDYSRDDEMACGANFAQLQRDNPELADKATELCRKLGLYGFWYRVNSARWEIAKALLEAHDGCPR